MSVVIKASVIINTLRYSEKSGRCSLIGCAGQCVCCVCVCVCVCEDVKISDSKGVEVKGARVKKELS